MLQQCTDTVNIPVKNKKKKKSIEKQICPACYQSGKNTELKLYQINLQDAVYLCPNSTHCLYPEGYGWTFVQRNIDDMGDSSSESASSADESNEINTTTGTMDEIENLIKKFQEEEKNSENLDTNKITENGNDDLIEKQIFDELKLLGDFSNNSYNFCDNSEQTVENIFGVGTLNSNQNYDFTQSMFADSINTGNSIGSNIDAQIILENELFKTGNEVNTFLPLDNLKTSHQPVVAENITDDLTNDLLERLNQLESNINRTINKNMNLIENMQSQSALSIKIVSNEVLPKENGNMYNLSESAPPEMQCFTIECSEEKKILLKAINSAIDRNNIDTNLNFGQLNLNNGLIENSRAGADIYTNDLLRQSLIHSDTVAQSKVVKNAKSRINQPQTNEKGQTSRISTAHTKKSNIPKIKVVKVLNSKNKVVNKTPPKLLKVGNTDLVNYSLRTLPVKSIPQPTTENPKRVRKISVKNKSISNSTDRTKSPRTSPAPNCIQKQEHKSCILSATDSESQNRIENKKFVEANALRNQLKSDVEFLKNTDTIPTINTQNQTVKTEVEDTKQFKIDSVSPELDKNKAYLKKSEKKTSVISAQNQKNKKFIEATALRNQLKFNPEFQKTAGLILQLGTTQPKIASLSNPQRVGSISPSNNIEMSNVKFFKSFDFESPLK